jgi:hypothetical protein
MSRTAWGGVLGDSTVLRPAYHFRSGLGYWGGNIRFRCVREVFP